MKTMSDLDFLQRAHGAIAATGPFEQKSTLDFDCALDFCSKDNLLQGNPALEIFKHLAIGGPDFESAVAACNPLLIDTPLLKSMPTDMKGESMWQELGYTALQFCALCDLHAQAETLLTRGANPQLYNANFTAVGICAYQGSAKTLAAMGAYGANLRLVLAAEHAPNSPRAAGSTLLHRVAAQFKPDKMTIARILMCSELSYPDFNAMTDQGETAFDWARRAGCLEEFTQAALAELAHREKQKLSSECGSFPAARHALSL